ncbi:MAG: hypothetical protein K6F87_03670 [Lachnospiraceae bacterium]|nr:hypothetical protein [Lachnospiraceae bacterium]
MNKTVCKKCGAEFDVSLVRCPFCGTAYAPAEEAEYMDTLEEVRKDLHSRIDNGNTRIKKGMRSAVRIILLAVIVILLFLFGLLWFSGRAERSRSDWKKEEFLQDQGITLQQEVTDK